MYNNQITANINHNDCKACSFTTAMGQAINHIKKNRHYYAIWLETEQDYQRSQLAPSVLGSRFGLRVLQIPSNSATFSTAKFGRIPTQGNADTIGT